MHSFAYFLDEKGSEACYFPVARSTEPKCGTKGMTKETELSPGVHQCVAPQGQIGVSSAPLHRCSLQRRAQAWV